MEFVYRGYYQLPLEQRLGTYILLASKIYDRNAEILSNFQAEKNYPSQDELDFDQLTEEFTSIAPRFKGRVISRLFHPSIALHYIIDSESLETLFNQSVFGRLTGKVIIEDDGVLAPQYKHLSGLVIVQPKMESSAKDRQIAFHEINHAIYSQYPNAKRRDALSAKLSEDIPTIDRVNTLISLNETIFIDEAAASMHPYKILGGSRGLFKTEYIEEVRGAMRNMIGFQLAAIRSSGDIDDFTVARINTHEIYFMRFPFLIQEAVENLVSRLRNPEKLEPLGYAISYVEEALQILNFNQIASDLEHFCLQVLEPYRLSRSIGFSL